jgi:hypothetical protein
MVPKVEHDNAGKRGGEGGAVCRERASRAAAGAGVAALDVECEYGGVSVGLFSGDASGGIASEAPRAATANAAPSGAFHRVDFSDACGPRTARMEKTSAPRSASSANESGASLKSPDSSTTCTTPSLDMAAARVGSGEWRTRRRVGATDKALAGTGGYLCGGRLELVCVPPLTTALALQGSPSTPQHRDPSLECRACACGCAVVVAAEFKRRGGRSGSSSETQKQNPRSWGQEVPAAALRCTRHRQARAANLPTPPRMPGMARGACGAMPAFAQALTLAPRGMLQKGGQLGEH